MHFLDAVALGIVEGITEFLPVSSTGHMILASHLLHLPDTEFLKSFEIIIQLGAICAVVALYYRTFFNIEILKKLIIGFIPTGIIGLALYKIVKTYLLGNEFVVLWALALGGIVLIIFELFHREREDSVEDIYLITNKQAFGIGLFQSISIIPGVSRSAATIVGGLLLGLKRATIVEFSFLLAVPTMAAATGLDLIKSYKSFSSSDAGMLAVGFIVAFAVALGAIKFLLQYIRTHTFIPFGVYRILAALLFWWIVLK